MNTFKVADFALSILPYPAAGAVFQTFGTVLHADKFVFRQAALLTSPARSQKFFHQAVVGSTVAVGVGKKHFAQFLSETFPAGDGENSRIVAGRRFVKGVTAAQNAIVKAVVVQCVGHLDPGLMEIVFIEPVFKAFEFIQS